MDQHCNKNNNFDLGEKEEKGRALIRLWQLAWNYGDMTR